MAAVADALRLDPRRVAGLDLSEMPSRRRRVLLRALLCCSLGALRVEGRSRLDGLPGGSVFALSHHGVWETLLAPATLVALRRGRPIRFLVDWMFAELPWTGWIVREIDPIPIYAKPARFGLRERRRRARRHFDPLAEAVWTLERGGDVGLYPEGTRRTGAGHLSRLRRGVAHLAMATGAPVIPVGIDLPAAARLGRKPRIGRVVVRIGAPIVAPPEAVSAGPENVRRAAARELLRVVEGELARLSRKLPARDPRRAGELRSVA